MLAATDFRELMKPLTRHWGDLSAEAWLDYYAVLAHLDARTLAAAVVKVLAEYVYPAFPKPAVIAAAAGDLQAPVARSGTEAWGEVTRAAIRWGGQRPPGERWTFDDPLISAAVDAVGWRNICEADEGAMMWPFVKAYDALTARRQAEARELPAITAERARLTEARKQISGVAAKLAAPRERTVNE